MMLGNSHFNQQERTAIRVAYLFTLYTHSLVMNTLVHIASAIALMMMM